MTQRGNDQLFERCCEDTYKAKSSRDYYIRGTSFFIWVKQQNKKVIIYNVGDGGN